MAGSGSKLGRRLLHSMSQDAPPPNAKKRALVALGIAQSIATATASTAAMSSAAGSTATSTTGTVAVGSLSTGTAATAASAISSVAAGATTKGAIVTALAAYSGLLAKPLLFGALAGAITAGGAQWPQFARHRTVVDQPVVSSASIARGIPRALAPHEGLAAPPPEVSPDITLQTPDVVDPDSRGAANGATELDAVTDCALPLTTTPSPQRSAARSQLGLQYPELGAETRELSAVRAWLASGQTERARHGLDRYDTQFANGLLRPEASILRIELLAETGDMVGARRLARAFETSHPTSSHLNKIHALVRQGALERDP